MKQGQEQKQEMMIVPELLIQRNEQKGGEIMINEAYEREGVISLKKVDLLVFRSIDNLEQAWRELTNARDFLPLDKDNIITCISLIQEASRIAKQAYYDYFETEYYSNTTMPLLKKYLTEGTFEKIVNDVR